MPQKYMGAAIGVGIAFAVFHFSKNTSVKSAALGILGVIVAKQIPYMSDALA